MSRLIHFLRCRWPILCASLPALVLLGVWLHYYSPLVSDDAYISFRYAENLATGAGLEWNPGYRVEGYSNFLWVVLLAGLRVLGLAAPDGAHLLSWTAAVLTVLVMVAAARRSTARPSWVLLALSPLPMVLVFSYQYWTALRLETPLFAFLLLLSVVLFVSEEERAAGPRWHSALAYLSLAMVRPEGPIFVAVPGVYLLSRIRSRRDVKRLLQERGLWLMLFVAGFALYTIWRLLYFGHFFPNTYYAKAGGDGLMALGWQYLTRFAPRPDALVLLLIVLLLGGTASRTVALLLGTVLTLALVVVLEGGDWMREFRLMVPAVPLLVTSLAISLQRAAAEPGSARRLAPAVGLIGLCVLTQTSLGTPWEEWSAAFRGAKRDVLINLEGEMTQVSARAAAWLKTHARPGDLVAVNHAGALPYYSGLPALDMAGLNDLHIARLPGRRHTKWDPAYVLSRRPRFIVLNTRTAPLGGRLVPDYWGGETALFRHPDFQRNYAPVPQHWTWRHKPIEMRNEAFVATAHIMIFERRDAHRSGPGASRAPSSPIRLTSAAP